MMKKLFSQKEIFSFGEVSLKIYTYQNIKYPPPLLVSNQQTTVCKI